MGRRHDGHVVAMGWTRRTPDGPGTCEVGLDGCAMAKRVVDADGAVRACRRLGRPHAATATWAEVLGEEQV